MAPKVAKAITYVLMRKTLILAVSITNNTKFLVVAIAIMAVSLMVALSAILIK